MNTEKVYCSQCHKSAYAETGRAGFRRLKLYCWHHRKFIPLDAKIEGCPYVIYENREYYFRGVWKAPCYNAGRCTKESV